MLHNSCVRTKVLKSLKANHNTGPDSAAGYGVRVSGAILSIYTMTKEGAAAGSLLPDSGYPEAISTAQTTVSYIKRYVACVRKCSLLVWVIIVK